MLICHHREGDTLIESVLKIRLFAVFFRRLCQLSDIFTVFMASDLVNLQNYATFAR